MKLLEPRINGVYNEVEFVLNRFNLYHVGCVLFLSSSGFVFLPLDTGYLNDFVYGITFLTNDDDDYAGASAARTVPGRRTRQTQRRADRS